MESLLGWRPSLLPQTTVELRGDSVYEREVNKIKLMLVLEKCRFCVLFVFHTRSGICMKGTRTFHKFIVLVCKRVGIL